jgi:hypothetical protein
VSIAFPFHTRPCLQLSQRPREDPNSEQSQHYVLALEDQQRQDDSSPTSANPSSTTLHKSSMSIFEKENETESHASNTTSDTPGLGFRCICGHEPKVDGKERNKASNLKRHQKTCNIHSPQTHRDRPYSCSILGCNKSYPRPDGLAVHRRSKHGSISDMKASSRKSFSKSSKVEDNRSSNGESSTPPRLRRRGAKYMHKGKRRAPSLSSQQDLFEDGAVQRAMPKRRRIGDQEPVTPYSWVEE